MTTRTRYLNADDIKRLIRDFYHQDPSNKTEVTLYVTESGTIRATVKTTNNLEPLIWTYDGEPLEVSLE